MKAWSKLLQRKRKCVLTLVVAMITQAAATWCPQPAMAQSAECYTRPLGDSKVIASVPLPGFPEGIAVRGRRIYVAGPAVLDPSTAPPGPAKIWVYKRKSGHLVREIPILPDRNIPIAAAAAIAFDDMDRLYVVTLINAFGESGIVRIDTETGEQTVYAGPFTPFYFTSPLGIRGPAPNDLAFDKHGNLYVTDSFQAAIWKIPPGGGTPEVWFHSPTLDGQFGPNGIRIDKKSKHLYFSVSVDAHGLGHVYRLPLCDVPMESDLTVFHTYPPVPTPAGPLPQAPDGVAFGRSGNLYVAMAVTSQISVLNDKGQQTAVYSGPAQTQDPANPLPWANPANIAFCKKTRSLLVTNHAHLTGLPDPSPLFAVFDVFVDDKPGRLFYSSGD